MKTFEIHSAQNGRFKNTRQLLTSKKARTESSRFLLEGIRAISSLTENRGAFTIKEFWVNAAESDHPEITKLVGDESAYLLPEPLFAQLTDTIQSQGIVAVVEHTPAPRQIQPDRGKYLLLDALRDPGNLGTIIRTAVGAGFDGIFLYGNCTELFNPKVLRSTMGMLPFIPVWHVDESIFAELATIGYELATTVVSGGENIFEKTFAPKTVLIIGSEAHGVSPEVAQHATVNLTIPTRAHCESLNAAIAAGICLFQIAAKSN
jgi:TrmH family RNA methyltransferase